MILSPSRMSPVHTTPGQPPSVPLHALLPELLELLAIREALVIDLEESSASWRYSFSWILQCPKFRARESKLSIAIDVFSMCGIATCECGLFSVFELVEGGNTCDRILTPPRANDRTDGGG